MDHSTMCAVTTNPDISGIGVRVALYIQSYLGLLAPAVFPTSSELHGSILKSSYLTALGLLLASIIQWRSTASLTFLDAVIVIYLSSMVTLSGSATIAGIFVGGLPSPPTLDDVIGIGLQIIFNELSALFGIIVWSLAHTFGLAAMGGVCTDNGIIHVVSWAMHPIAATSPKMRVPALILLSFALLFNTLVMIIVLLRVWRKIKAGKPIVSDPGSGSSEEKGGRKPIKTFDLSFGAFMGSILLTFWAVTIELLISWNGLREQANTWTLGQMLAILMLMPPLLDVTVAMYNSQRKRNKRKDAVTLGDNAVEEPKVMLDKDGLEVPNRSATV